MDKKGSAQTTNIVLAVIVIIVLAFLGSSWSKYKQNNTDAENASTEVSADTTTEETATEYTVAYNGVEGKNAFELLQENATDVQYTESEYGAFVTGIDGVDAPEGYFWALYVNDEMAQLGASDLITTNDDLVRWQLDKIEY